MSTRKKKSTIEGKRRKEKKRQADYVLHAAELHHCNHQQGSVSRGRQDDEQCREDLAASGEPSQAVGLSSNGILPSCASDN